VCLKFSISQLQSKFEIKNIIFFVVVCVGTECMFMYRVAFTNGNFSSDIN